MVGLRPLKYFTEISLFSILSLLVISIIPLSFGHQLFNSEESRVGGYILQIATDPEIPIVGNLNKILFKISDRDYVDVIDARIGMKIYKNDILLKEWHPRILSNGHLEIDYIFIDPGIYIVEIDLYTFEGNVITESFNISTLNPFGYMFYSLVLIGVLFPASLFGFLLLYRRLKGKH